jgi:hypothetical protein
MENAQITDYVEFCILNRCKLELNDSGDRNFLSSLLRIVREKNPIGKCEKRGFGINV